MTPQQSKLLTEYHGLTRLQQDYQDAKTDTYQKRCQVVASMNASGMSYRAIAGQIGLSRSMVQVMVEKGRRNDLKR